MNLEVAGGVTEGLQTYLPAWDLFVVGFFILGVLLYTFCLTRKNIVLLFASIYIAFAIVSQASVIYAFYDDLHRSEQVSMRIGFFVVFFGLLFFLLSGSSLADGSGSFSFKWQSLLAGVLLAGLLLTCVLGLLPTTVSGVFGGATRLFFLTALGTSFWLIAPVLFLVLLTRMDFD